MNPCFHILSYSITTLTSIKGYDKHIIITFPTLFVLFIFRKQAHSLLQLFQWTEGYGWLTAVLSIFTDIPVSLLPPPT